MVGNHTDFKVRVIKGTGKTRYFTDWIEEKTEEGSLKFNFRLNDEGYVSDRITEKDLSTWTPRIPVIISTPTGSGKNTFIQTTLLKYAVSNRVKGENDRILILSNRIALSRQSKRRFAEKVVEYTGNYGCLERLDTLYTAEGSDKLCFNFGPVTVCSYHQLWERKLFEHHHYKYVVCDECHFFTNDSTFNPNTDAILQYIINECQSSIRIYMSATIDTVIEPIIRGEYSLIEQAVRREEEWLDRKYGNPIARFNSQANPYYTFNNPTAILRRYKSEHPLIVQFYYMHRTYPQINHVYYFTFMRDMINKVLADDDRSHKWLFFVSDSKGGERISADFNNSDRKSTFLSRRRVDEMEDIKKAYDAIITNESFKDDVLVTTAILDNGINLKTAQNGDKVRGVVIDVFKKDQFIQMLGRVRADTSKQLNLFVRKLGKDELKTKMTRILDALVKRLRTDQESIEVKKRFYDNEAFRFTSDKEGFLAYNQLAILQLCTMAIPILKCIEDRGIVEGVHCSTVELDACRIKALEYYKDGDGRYNPYADLIASILQCQQPNPSCKMQTFQEYLENRLIRNYCQEQIEAKVDKLKALSSEAANELDWEEDDMPDILKRTPMERLQKIVELLKKRGFHLTTPEEDRYDAIEDHYTMRGFANLEVEMDSVKVQMEWLNMRFDEAKGIEEV